MCIRDSFYTPHVSEMRVDDAHCLHRFHSTRVQSYLEHADEHEGLLGSNLSLILISEPTRLGLISYAVFCLKKKKYRKFL